MLIKKIVRWFLHVKHQRLILVLLAITFLVSIFFGFVIHNEQQPTNLNRRKRYSENDEALKLLMKSASASFVSQDYVNKNEEIEWSAEEFSCDRGTKVFNASVINDDYCDCEDGSDETKTSACVNNKFECLNKERIIPSSYVSDGICDCCDGSDEQDNMQARPDRLFVIPEHPIVNYAPCKYTCGTK